MRAVRSTVVVVGLALGCRGPAVTATGQTTLPTPTETPTSETTGKEGFPEVFTVEASFGVRDGEAVGGFDAAGAALPITLTIVLTTNAALDRTETRLNTCRITLTHPGPLPEAPWVSDAGAWFGFEMPPEAAVTDDCDLVTFAEDAWGDDPVAAVTRWRWGVGLNDVNPATNLIVSGAMSDAEWSAAEPFLVGSGWFSPLGITHDAYGYPADPRPFGYNDLDIADAFAVDAGMKLVLADGAPKPVRREDLARGATPAWYETTAILYLSPADRLVLADPATVE